MIFMFFSYESAILVGHNGKTKICDMLIKANPDAAFLNADRNPPPVVP